MILTASDKSQWKVNVKVVENYLVKTTIKDGDISYSEALKQVKNSPFYTLVKTMITMPWDELKDDVTQIDGGHAITNLDFDRKEAKVEFVTERELDRYLMQRSLT